MTKVTILLLKLVNLNRLTEDKASPAVSMVTPVPVFAKPGTVQFMC